MKRAGLEYIVTLLLCVTLFTSGCLQTLKDQSSGTNLSSELKMHNNRATLFINGQPHDGLFCSVRSPYMQNFIDAGFDIFDTHPGTPHGWIGDNTYDYSETDKYIDAYLKQKPDAKLIIRFWFGYPRDFWWAVKYKEHQVVPKVLDKGKKMPSYASLKWREEAGEALRRAIDHCEQKYGNNIIAYVPGGGSCGEWFQWYSYTEDPERHTRGYGLADYSEPMLQAYIKYVKEKYQTIDRVNQEYGLDLESFDQLQIPDVAERLNANIGILRNVSEEQAVLDYYEIFNQQVSNTLLHFAKKAKEGCDRKKVVMVFYGYHWIEQPSGGVTHARSGHTHLDEVISCPDVDYIIGPYHYCFRQTEGVMSGQGVVASVIRRNKQYVQELDGSTHIKPSWPCKDHHLPQNVAETGQLLRRDMSKSMMEGASLWFMDLFQGMYDSKEMVDELGEIIDAGRKHYSSAGYNNRQVAVVLQSRDAFYYRENEPLRAPLIPQFKQFELERMGLGYDDLMLENLKYLNLDETEQYKFWIFPSSVHFSEEELELVKKHCMRNGNHILWCYAPGVLSANGLDMERMEQISGFRCNYTMEPGELAVETITSEHPVLKGRNSPISYGTYGELSPDHIKYHSSLMHYPGSDVGFSIAPRFYIEEADTVLGHILDIDGQPGGLGIKDMGNWISVYSAAPLVPKHILRNIALEAGCHVYTDFLGQTYQSKNYVGFFAHETGQCRIQLPFRSKVVNAFNNKVLADKTDVIDISLKVNDAVLFHYEPVDP